MLILSMPSRPASAAVEAKVTLVEAHMRKLLISATRRKAAGCDEDDKSDEADEDKKHDK